MDYWVGVAAACFGLFRWQRVKPFHPVRGQKVLRPSKGLKDLFINREIMGREWFDLRCSPGCLTSTNVRMAAPPVIAVWWNTLWPADVRFEMTCELLSHSSSSGAFARLPRENLAAAALLRCCWNHLQLLPIVLLVCFPAARCVKLEILFNIKLQEVQTKLYPEQMPPVGCDGGWDFGCGGFPRRTSGPLYYREQSEVVNQGVASIWCGSEVLLQWVKFQWGIWIQRKINAKQGNSSDHHLSFRCCPQSSVFSLRENSLLLTTVNRPPQMIQALPFNCNTTRWCWPCPHCVFSFSCIQE